MLQIQIKKVKEYFSNIYPPLERDFIGYIHILYIFRKRIK